MENKKFHSFQEVFTYRLKTSPNQILFQTFDSTRITDITASDFYQLLQARISSYRKEQCSCKAIIGTTTIDTIISFFASVMSGKQTILIDSSYEIHTICKIIKMGDVDSTAIEADIFDEDELDQIRNSLCAYDSCHEPTDNHECSAVLEGNTEGDILFFTSGTTGVSKAVVLDSKILLSSAYNGQSLLPCTPSDKVLSVLPLTHVFGFVCTLLWPLVYDGTIALGRGMRYLLEDPKVFHPTILPLVPTATQYLIVSNAVNPELRTLLIGAGPISDTLITAIHKLGISLSFGYGLTETASGVALSTGDDPYRMTVCPESKIEIIDGEVTISSTCLMKGYYKNVSATQDVIKDGKLYTKDLGYLNSDGTVVITGRKDDVLVLANGTKINCKDYEAALFYFIPVSDLAILLKNNELTLVYYPITTGVHYDQATIESKVNEFNRTQAVGQKINKIELTDHPFERTATGKIKKYLL